MNTKTKIIFSAIATLAALSLFQNCSSFKSPAGTTAGSSQSVVTGTGGAVLATSCTPASAATQAANAAAATALLQAKCVSCHSPTSNPVSSTIPNILDFSRLQNAKSANGTNELVMGSPQTSNLYLRVVDGVEPHNGPALGTADLNTLRDWILADKVPCDVLASGPGNPNPVTIGAGGTTPTTPPIQTATFTQVNNQIIQQSCVGCHGPGGSAPDLTSYAGVKANAALSLGDIQNGTMPKGGAKLSSTLATLFANWIAGGMLNN